ncbi:MAG: DUF3488 domain-containing transglutaminase family protein [Gammaproteobacteria bacterium]|nr:DUF3488 domain-containing transglutaminase family protein [Gammaproteobacteria bacterium]
MNKKASGETPNVSAESLLWIIAALCLVIAPHIPRLPPWVSISFGVLALWRYLVVRGTLRQLPSAMFCISVAFLLMIGILVTYRTLFGRDAGVALLAGLIGLKLIEMRSLREAMLLVFLGYFLIITNFLYSQTIPMAAYLIAVMLVMTAALISLSDNSGILSIKRRMRLSAVLLLQALPLVAVLFLLFPRVEGPLWKLPGDAHAGMAGLSSSMSPGSISQLIRSNAVAFRVKFSGVIPPPELRYWRGPVLWASDGYTWTSGILPEYTKPALETYGDPINYTVTQEPHNQPWLFALDLPEKAPEDLGWSTADYQLRAKEALRKRTRFQIRSYSSYRARTFTLRQSRYAVRLPQGKHPRARALAAKWRRESPDPKTFVQRVLQHFHTEAFVYTLQPPLLPDDPVDEFLFDTRKGFCGHYATAFTVLMRAAGIPARVVTGYQGGEINSLDGYMAVRQSDAHAWSEVWLAKNGWVRFDPTAVVAPSRVEQGIDTAIPERLTAFGFKMARDSSMFKMFRQLRNAWDALGNRWNQWVLGYGPARQRELLAFLGLERFGYQGMAVALTAILGALLLGTAAWMFFVHRPLQKQEPAQRLYQRFCTKLARGGLIRLAGEGPLHFADRVIAQRPELTRQVRMILRLYMDIRYRERSKRLLKPFARAIKRFAP